MISVTEAIAKIRENAELLPPVSRPLAEALGLVLAEDIYAGISLPPFNQSAMDGYAFRYADAEKSSQFIINSEVAAGDKGMNPFLPRQAIRIFTGAPVPEGFDTVVMQEKTVVENGMLLIRDEDLVAGSNVRIEGAEIRKGDLAMRAGTVLSPAAIGYLAGLGVTEVSIHPAPAVHLIVTGKELQQPGHPLQRGQVYESNSVMLQAALAQLHIRCSGVSVVGDDREETAAALATALAGADLVLLTGGVSVGDYDFVVQAAASCGVQEVFHKVAQRPGKPLYVGRKGSKIVLGLPGNPASVLSCFYNYVVVAIECFTGRQPLLERKRLPLLDGFSKRVALRQFLKGACSPDGVRLLAAQESFRLSSFSAANCLVILPEGPGEFAPGDTVEVLLLPYL